VNDADTGLVQMQQRYYEPLAARFLSVDPVTTDANTGSSFNRYVYANNNPYKFHDPDGRQAALSCAGQINCSMLIDHGSPESNAQGLSGTRADQMVGQGLKASVYALVPGAECAVDGGCGIGGWGLAAVSAVPGGGAATTGLRAAKNAFEIAIAGGKHAGFLRNYVGRTPAEIQKGIASIEKQVADHQSWIANPQSRIQNFGALDPRQQAALINSKWPSDIARQREQLDILKGLLGGN
jgi:RHS repeat-associated protein